MSTVCSTTEVSEMLRVEILAQALNASGHRDATPIDQLERTSHLFTVVGWATLSRARLFYV